MPIELPPLSRRRFLAGSLAAGVGTWAGINAWATDAKPEIDAHRWVLFSDPHISERREEVRAGVRMADNLAEAVKKVVEAKQPPAGLMVNGDCAYATGKVADYQMFLDLIKPAREFGATIHLTLGNHDHRQRFWESIPEEKPKSPEVANRQVGMLKTDRANWFLLDSLLETAKTPGELGTDQLDWLAKSLDANTDKPALVMGHHHPWKNNGQAGLIDAEALFDVLAPRKHVKAYIFGHTHHWEVSKRGDIHLVNLPPVGYVFKAGEPSGWVELNLGTDSASVQIHTIDPKHAADGQKFDLAWR